MSGKDPNILLPAGSQVFQCLTRFFPLLTSLPVYHLPPLRLVGSLRAADVRWGDEPDRRWTEDMNRRHDGKIERRAAPCCRFFVCLSILPWDNIEPRTWQKNSIYERLIIELIWRFHKDNSLPKDYFLLTVLLLPFPSARVSVLSLQSFPRLSRYGRKEKVTTIWDEMPRKSIPKSRDKDNKNKRKIIIKIR